MERQSASTFSGRTCTQYEAVQWVASKLAVDDVTADQAPSAEAWWLLAYARENETEFMKNLYTRMLPSQKELQEKLAFEDDGRRMDNMYSRLLTRATEIAGESHGRDGTG